MLLVNLGRSLRGLDYFRGMRTLISFEQDHQDYLFMQMLSECKCSMGCKAFAGLDLFEVEDIARSMSVEEADRLFWIESDGPRRKVN